MSKIKGLKTAHTSNDKIGKGFDLGSGIKNPGAKLKSSFMDMPSRKSKTMGKAPKALA